MTIIIWTAITGGAIHFALVFLGLALSEVTTVAIGMQMVVPFATILSIVFLNETIGWKRWLGISLSFTGVVIIGFDPKVFSYIHGLVLVIMGAFVAAVSMLLMKRIRGVKVFQIQAWLALISAPLLLVTSLLFEENQLAQISTARLDAWGALLYTAFAASLVGHGGFYYLIQRYEMSQVAPLTLLAAVFAVFFGVVLLGDELSNRTLQGGFLALLGVLLITLRQTTGRVAPTGGGSIVRKIDQDAAN